MVQIAGDAGELRVLAVPRSYHRRKQMVQDVVETSPCASKADEQHEARRSAPTSGAGSDARPSADSDEAARVYRALSAHRSNLMAPTILI